VRFKGLLLVSALVGAVGALGLAAAQMGGAQADATGALPLSGFYQMAVDSANQHLFISQGSASENSILVTNFAGTKVASITGQDGVMGITLAPGGKTLYAALAGSHAVSAISTATLKQTALYKLPAADSPQDVAVQSGELWVSYSIATVGQPGAIGDFDLTAAKPAFATPAAMAGWSSTPMLAADPSNTGVLVAVEPWISPAAEASYDTATNPATVLAQTTGATGICDNANDVAVIPGGGQFISTCDAPDADFVQNTADLTELGSYPAGTNQDPNAIAIASGDGTVAAGRGAGNGSDIYVYAPGGDILLNTFSTGSLERLAARGLGLSANGSRLFAVTDDSGGYGLHVYDNPAITRTTLTLGGPATSRFGHRISLNGSLRFGNGTYLPAGTAVAILRTGGTGATVKLVAKTKANGAFTLSDTPPTHGIYTYVVSYAGGATVESAIARLTVTVTEFTSSFRIAGPSSAEPGQTITFTGQLKVSKGMLPAGTTFTVTRTVQGRTGSKTWHISAGAAGAFALTDRLTAWGTYHFTATYAGTSLIAGTRTSSTVTVAGKTASLTLAADPGTVAYDHTVGLTAHLGATYTNRTLSVYAQPFGGARELLTVAMVNSSGNLTVRYVAAHSTTFTVVFAGDARYLPVTVERVVYVRARVSMAISGYYASKRIGGVTYRLYHHTAALDAVITVAPNKSGECTELQVQEYFQGAWHANVVSRCGTLDAASRANGDLTLTKADLGDRYRVRAHYVRGSDTSNLGAHSGWLYFMVEK
jgi:hypothetical protein